MKLATFLHEGLIRSGWQRLDFSWRKDDIFHVILVIVFCVFDPGRVDDDTAHIKKKTLRFPPEV